MKKPLLIVSALSSLLVVLSFGKGVLAAESITLSPSVATCDSLVSVVVQGLNPSTNYTGVLQCTTPECNQTSTIILGSPTPGSTSFGWSETFDVDGACGSGSPASAGTYRAFLLWDSGNQAAMSPTTIILSPAAGNCNLTSALNPIYVGADALFNLTDGNPNTTYEFLLDGSSFGTEYTTFEGDLVLDLGTFSTAGDHIIDAKSTFPDPGGQKNCTVAFSIEVANQPPAPGPGGPPGSIPPAQTTCFASPPATGSCTFKGRATTHFVNDEGRRFDKNFQGLGFAWIDEPIIPNGSAGTGDTVETFAYTSSDQDGYFELKNIRCDEPVHIGVFCGSRVMDVYGIEWDKTGDIVEIPIRYAEQLNCGSNDYCVRPEPDDSPIACEDKNDPEQLKVRYPWAEPQQVSGFTIIAACLNNQNILKCLELAWAYLSGENSLQATEFNLDRVARIESTKFALGCAPEGVASCEDIKQINEDSSGINLGRCGRSWVMGKDPGGITKTCKIPYDDPITGGQDVCTQANGDIVKFNQIQLPNTKDMDSNDVLSSEYFPYYLCFQDPADNGRAEAEAIPTVSGVDEDYTCSGTTCNVDSDPTTEEGSTTSVITKDGTASLETANKSGLSIAGMYSRPGKDVTEKTPGTGSTTPSIESGITRTRWYGSECVVPEGGVTYSFAQAILDGLCNNPSNPGSCPIPNYIPISLESKVPYVENFSSFGVAADYIKRPGKTTPYNSCGGTTSGTTEQTEDRDPFSSDACATPMRAKEDIMDTFKLQNFDVGN